MQCAFHHQFNFFCNICSILLNMWHMCHCVQFKSYVNDPKGLHPNSRRSFLSNILFLVSNLELGIHHHFAFKNSFRIIFEGKCVPIFFHVKVWLFFFLTSEIMNKYHLHMKLWSNMAGWAKNVQGWTSDDLTAAHHRHGNQPSCF